MAQVQVKPGEPIEIALKRFKKVLQQDGVLKAARARAIAAGIAEDRIILDPGIGFGKTPAQNLMLVRDLAKITALGFPVLLGTSRKSTLGLVLGEADPLRRGPGNDVTAAWGIAQGASMIRVHDVAALRPIVRMADALRRGPSWEPEARA